MVTMGQTISTPDHCKAKASKTFHRIASVIISFCRFFRDVSFYLQTECRDVQLFYLMFLVVG